MNSPTQTTAAETLNQSALACWDMMARDGTSIRGTVHQVGGARILDVGIDTPGSIRAGVGLAKICLGDAANVTIAPAPAEGVTDCQVQVWTDCPVQACLGGQYAGWPVSSDKFFAMGSGPMRMWRGREDMLTHLQLAATANEQSVAVGVLECDAIPGPDVIAAMASACGVDASRLSLAVAPSTSIAGAVQVVARSIETAMHKLHALEFDVTQVLSASGVAPLPPPAKPGDTVGGIGRTNDAMLYGARVTLYVDADDDDVQSIAAKVPSESSGDHGRPFKDIFKDYGYDFYKVDPMLFSPAVVTISNLRSGRSWRHGHIATDVLRQSFGL